jgi:hypothetical protein
MSSFGGLEQKLWCSMCSILTPSGPEFRMNSISLAYDIQLQRVRGLLASTLQQLSEFVHVLLFGLVLYPGLVIHPLDCSCVVCSTPQPSKISRTGSCSFNQSFVYIIRFLTSLVLCNLKRWSSCYGHTRPAPGFL